MKIIQFTGMDVILNVCDAILDKSVMGSIKKLEEIFLAKFG